MGSQVGQPSNHHVPHHFPHLSDGRLLDLPHKFITLAPQNGLAFLVGSWWDKKVHQLASCRDCGTAGNQPIIRSEFLRSSSFLGCFFLTWKASSHPIYCFAQRKPLVGYPIFQKQQTTTTYSNTIKNIETCRKVHDYTILARIFACILLGVCSVGGFFHDTSIDIIGALLDTKG